MTQLAHRRLRSVLPSIASWAWMAVAACLLVGIAVRPDKAAGKPYIPVVPDDMGQVEIYLLTTGVGNNLADRFGHTGIRVLDRESGVDAVFNWGQYSFDDPSFAWNFFKGRLIYSMGVSSYRYYVNYYDDQQRHLWQDKLNLTSNQKRELLQKIAWNSRPENRKFPYQYWYQNCSTIPRDYINQVLEGAVRARYYHKSAGVDFRHYVRKHLSAIPLVVPGLDVLMNSNIDRPITKWEEMFLPEKLREHLLVLPAFDDEGNPLEGRHLLTESQVLLDHGASYASEWGDYVVLTSLGAGPLVWAWILIGRRRRQQVVGTLGYRLAGVAALIWWTLSAMVGTVLLLGWMFSGHADSWHNSNLFLFWPVDFLLVAYGFSLLRGGHPVKDNKLFVHSGQILAWAHIVAFILLIVLAGVGMIEQDVWRVVVWFGTLTSAMSLFFVTVGLERKTVPAAEGTSSEREAVMEAELQHGRMQP